MRRWHMPGRRNATGRAVEIGTHAILMHPRTHSLVRGMRKAGMRVEEKEASGGEG